MTASVTGFLFLLERVSTADDIFVTVSVFIQATSAETTYIVLGCLVEPQPVCLFECLRDSVEGGVIFYSSDIRTEIILVHRAKLFLHDGGWTIKPVTLAKENMRRKIHFFLRRGNSGNNGGRAVGIEVVGLNNKRRSDAVLDRTLVGSEVITKDIAVLNFSFFHNVNSHFHNRRGQCLSLIRNFKVVKFNRLLNFFLKFLEHG